MIHKKYIENNIIYKWCFICKLYKPTNQFGKNLYQSDKLSSGCKSCRGKYEKDYQSKYYINHKDDLLPKHRISAKKSNKLRRQRIKELKNK
jgi:hypothetical protein